MFASFVLLICLLFLPIALQANVFGDGNPDNGTEDDRQPLTSSDAVDSGIAGWQASAGTIFCDGRNRGSATIIDVTEFDPDSTGVYLATAAHLFYDLGNGERFSECRFQYMGLDQMPKYHRSIDPQMVSLGSFNPLADYSDKTFGEGDWAFVYFDQQGSQFWPGVSIKPMAIGQSSEFEINAKGVHLLAYNADRRELSVSSSCVMSHSTESDLGGGQWEGQWLDNCDSGRGASGGGLVIREGSSSHLVAIRNGSHWSDAHYPQSVYPQGPPEGSPWSAELNTNFARSLDETVLDGLRLLVKRVGAKR